VLVRLAPAGDELNLYQEGAIRHIFLLGFVLPLMLAMAHIVLARFGAGYIPWQNLLTAGFLLGCVAVAVPPHCGRHAGRRHRDYGTGRCADDGGARLTAAVCVRTAVITDGRSADPRAMRLAVRHVSLDVTAETSTPSWRTRVGVDAREFDRRHTFARGESP
jgi:hypothetical protein